MTERNAYTGRFRKAGAAPAGKLSPEAEAEIERLMLIWSDGDSIEDLARAAMVWAYRDAAALCRAKAQHDYANVGDGLQRIAMGNRCDDCAADIESCVKQ